MPNIQYNIHDLISITIDEGVNKAIIRDIDFQIRYFKISSNGHPSPRQIRIAPFERFPAANQNSFEMFHLVEGLEGNAFRDPDGQFALQRVQGGFEIYSDQPMFLINLFIQLLLIEQGISLIHAAA
ncbi:MAG: hypothetical protein JW860_03025, partial [Sedimentisphaerales bacterium]|nr:hypothetical protein [Sedimentisphaerales bacterium]